MIFRSTEWGVGMQDSGEANAGGVMSWCLSWATRAQAQWETEENNLE